MPNKFTTLPALALGLALAAWPISTQAQQPEPAEAGAGERQEPRTIVWILDDAALANDEARQIARKAPAIIGRIVKDSGDRHVVALRPEELADWLSRNPRPTPACLQGASRCKNPTAALMESLGADLLVRGRLSSAGPRWTLEVEMFGPTGNSVLERKLQGGGVEGTGAPVTPERGLEQLAFEAVRELFQATGSLEIVSTPPGAEVAVDGSPQGTTPLVIELPIGAHEVALTLADHAPESRPARINARERTLVEVTLSARMATVTVDTTPVQGEVFIDNRSKGTAGVPFQLPAGEHELEIRAEGYKTRTQRLILVPDEQKILSLTLEPKRPELNVTAFGEVSTEAIMARNYFARASYRFASLSTGLSESEGVLADEAFLVGDLGSAEGGLRDFGFHGLHLDVGHNWEHFGLVALGLSILSSGDRAEGDLLSEGSVPREGVEFDNFSRLEVRPAQLTFRYPYKNLFPSVQTGFGFHSTTFTADAAELGAIDMEQTGFFWGFSIEASYFFDSWWYGFSSLGIQRDLSHDDTDTQMSLSFGVGITFENPLVRFGLRSAEPPREAE